MKLTKTKTEFYRLPPGGYLKMKEIFILKREGIVQQEQAVRQQGYNDTVYWILNGQNVPKGSELYELLENIYQKECKYD
jgi:hypothetical protein